MFTIIVKENTLEMASAAFEVLKEVLDKKPNAVLGLATGSSPIGLYKKMIEDHKLTGRSYKDVVTFNLDEYVHLDRTHSQSYYTFMKEHLFDFIDIDLKNVHIPNGNADDFDAEVKRYEEELSKFHVDVQVMGIGSNGHIGFNEPETPFTSTTHIEALKESTRNDNARFFASIDDVPTHAVTMGIASIMKAKKIILLASTSYKAKAIAAMIHGPVTENCPASVLQNHPDVVVIIDKAAASLLTDEGY
ncbi:MAG: glucosamine-6-phosphate deaminase [Firmicutes bacterium HGW-Firmicutes-10]|nr:MAG: glucosamine-6-phosphate deaminase [Firmicutes bacterium HGW-Firmicutes-10]